ncbi:unnamed protein product, partial [Coregonus sp. 'balchen']
MNYLHFRKQRLDMTMGHQERFIHPTAVTRYIILLLLRSLPLIRLYFSSTENIPTAQLPLRYIIPTAQLPLRYIIPYCSLPLRHIISYCSVTTEIHYPLL